MPKLNLTSTSAFSAPCPVSGSEARYFDTKETGLYLSVTKAGRRSFCFRYRALTGSMRQITLGPFPALSVQQARLKAQVLRVAVAEGEDPAQAARDQKAENLRQLSQDTFAAVSRRYIDAAQRGRHRPRNGRPWADATLTENVRVADILEKHIGDVALTHLSRHRLTNLLDDIERQTSKSTAIHSHIFLSGLFTYARWQEIVVTNPMEFVPKGSFESRDIVLADDQIRTLLHLLRNPVRPTPMSIAIELALLTAQRAGEVGGILLGELDLTRQEWIVPAHRAKNRREHTIALSDRAVDLIEQALGNRKWSPKTPLFPSPADEGTP